MEMEAAGGRPASRPPEQQSPSARGRRGTLLATWLPTIVFGAVLPLFTYLTLSGRGFSEVVSLSVAAVWPALELLVFYALHKRVDELGVIILGFLAISVIVAVVFSSPRVLVIRESALTGLLGVAMLVSLTMRRPLGFYFGRKFGTDGSPAGVEWWNGLWQYPTFRRSQYVITTVWGAVFTLEAVIRIVLTFILPLNVMSFLSFLFPIIVMPGLAIFTVLYARRTRSAAPAPA